jgi:hypothetical protein
VRPCRCTSRPLACTLDWRSPRHVPRLGRRRHPSVLSNSPERRTRRAGDAQSSTSTTVCRACSRRRRSGVRAGVRPRHPPVRSVGEAFVVYLALAGDDTHRSCRTRLNAWRCPAQSCTSTAVSHVCETAPDERRCSTVPPACTLGWRSLRCVPRLGGRRHSPVVPSYTHAEIRRRDPHVWRQRVRQCGSGGGAALALDGKRKVRSGGWRVL